MLATWLVEFYLGKCDELDDLCASETATSDVENVQAERAILEEDLCHFFETYKVSDLGLVLTACSSLSVGKPGSQYRVRTYTISRANRHAALLRNCGR